MENSKDDITQSHSVEDEITAESIAEEAQAAAQTPTQEAEDVQSPEDVEADGAQPTGDQPADEAEKAEGEQPRDEAENAEDDKGKKGKKRRRPKRTKEQRKKAAIKALIAVSAIVLVIAIFVSGLAIANTIVSKAMIKQAGQFQKIAYDNQLEPEKDGDWYSFTLPEGREEFKIVQLTDVHIGAGSFSKNKDTWAMNAVATMLQAEKPDLVIVTGDITFPVPYASGSFDNLNGVKVFSTMMEKLGVYWTFAFGNHDTEAYAKYSRTDICEYYESANLKYCLFTRGFCDTKDYIGNDSRGFGNAVIKVKNHEGKVVQALVMLDSHSYIEGDYFGLAWKYDNIHQCQIDWYKEQMEQISTDNGDGQPVKNMLFFHIPLMEYRSAWKDLVENCDDITPGAITPDGTRLVSGVRGETDKERHNTRTYGVFCGMGEDTLFETAKDINCLGMFCGHDHYNNFSVVYQGVRLTYGMSVDYLAYPGIYKKHLQRGCTVIEIDDSGAFVQNEYEGITPKNYYKDYDVAYEKPEK